MRAFNPKEKIMLELELQSLSLEDYVRALCGIMSRDSNVMAETAVISHHASNHDLDVMADPAVFLDSDDDHDLDVRVFTGTLLSAGVLP